MSNYEKYDLHNVNQDNQGNSCKNKNYLNSCIGASSFFQKIKSNLSNLIFLNKEDGIDNKSIKIFENSTYKILGNMHMQSNEINQVYDAPTLELNMSNELDNPIHINTNPNQEYTNKNINDTHVRKFSLDSSRTTQTKKKSNPITRIVQYITEKKYDTSEKIDVRNSSFVSKHSAFKPIDNRTKIINLNSKKIINYNDFFEVMTDKNIIKPVPIKRSSSTYSQLAKKRNRPLDTSYFFREEERVHENGDKRRKMITDEEKSLFSSVQNLNKIRNSQRDDVSMKSINSVMSHRFLKEDKDKNKLEKNVNDDVSMNYIIPENKSVVRSYYSKTLDEIKSEIEQKRGKNLKMLDEISRKSKKSREEAKLDYDEKKRFLSNYYKEKEKNFKEMDLLSKGGKISLDESDLIRDKNLSYSKSSMTIESAGKKNKNVDIVKISNFDICSEKSGKSREEKEIPKESFGFKTNENLNQNVLFGQDKKIQHGDTNALTNKKITFGEKAETKDNSTLLIGENKTNLFSAIPNVTTKVNAEPDVSKSLFANGFATNKSVAEDKTKAIENSLFSNEVKGVKETEKKEEKKPSFGFGVPIAKEEAKPILFGKVEKMEDTPSGPSTLFGEKKEDKGALFGSMIKKEEKTGTFNQLFDKKEEISTEIKDKKEEKLGFFVNADKKEEKPAITFGAPTEKKEEKYIFSAFDNKPEEQKTPSFSLLNQESSKKAVEEQKPAGLFSSISPKTTLEEKKVANEKDQTKTAEEKSQPTSIFNFPTTINTKGTSLGASTITTPTLFSGLKDGKEEKSTPTFGVSTDNTKSSLFNFDNKPASDTTPKIFGTVPTPAPSSLLNEPAKNTTTDASAAFLKKDQTSSSLVNDSNPFLKTYGGESKAPTIFQSPNKPGIPNIFNLSTGEGMANNPITTPAFNSGIGMNKINSSINNSNRSSDIFENLEKNGNKTPFPAQNFGSGQSLLNPSNPFLPKANNGPKNDLFGKSGDHNDNMAISPITSPKMMPKIEEVRPNNIFPNSANFGGNMMGNTTSNLFNTSNNSFPTVMNTSNTMNTNAFTNPTNNVTFSNPNPTQGMPFGNAGGLFSQFGTGSTLNQPTGTMFSNPTGSGLSFSLGKKK
jgi:hypothetical protein